MRPVLLIINTPPPYQGTTIMNKLLIDCFRKENIAFIHQRVESARDLNNLGKISLTKLKSAALISKSIFSKRKNYDVAYLVMSVEGFAFYRHAFFILLLQLMGKKCILHLRGLGFSNKTGISKFITQSLFKRSFLIQHSPYNQFDISGYKNKKTFFVPNGWEDHYSFYSEQIEARLNTRTDKIQLVFLSNLIADKGLFTVLKAMELIQSKRPVVFENTCWNFIGKWENEATETAFRTHIKKNWFSARIGHVGPLYNEEKYAFLAHMHILTFPTFYKHETWGNVILEAMMFKIPVIATRYVAIPEMIKPGENGFLISKNDAEALANHIIQLAEQPALRKQLGEKSRELFLENFTLSRFEQNMMSVIKEVNQTITR